MFVWGEKQNFFFEECLIARAKSHDKISGVEKSTPCTILLTSTSNVDRQMYDNSSTDDMKRTYEVRLFIRVRTLTNCHE